MANMTINVQARFDNILDIAREIGELQTYKLFPDDDMLLVERNDVLEVLKRHVVTVTEKRKTGTWVEDRTRYKCSVCGKSVDDEIFYMFDPYRMPTYCPNCGVKMEGADSDD